MVATAPAETIELPSSIEAGGIVRARITALVASRVMATITAVHVRAGDRVRRGDPLVTLDARDFHADQTRAEAALLSASESARAAESDVRAAESSVQLARLTHDRVAALQAKRSATVEELDQAVAALAGAEAQRAGAQARLAAATAGRDAAMAAADAAGVMSTYASVTAPFDGIVTERNAEAGSMATPGAPLLTLDDPTTYRLEVRLDEARAALVSSGTTVDVRLDTGDATLAGRVSEVARVDPASHGFLVKIDLPATAGLRSGQFGRARFSGAPRHALTAPASAVVRRGQLTFVFVADADRRARLRPVSIGDTAGDRVEVLAGLRQGEPVVIAPEASLRDGAPIAGARP
jgi:RND family efflux transporter MFP subunit